MAGNTAKTKQVIVMRKDLPMNAGKVCAQGSHASLGALLNKNISKDRNKIAINLEEHEIEWFNDKFTKVVLEAKNEKELIKIKKHAEEDGLTVVEIIDAGHTTFEKPTLTCIAIGPAYKEDIDKITKKLQMFKRTSRERLMEKFLIQRIRELEKDPLENVEQILEIRKILNS